MSLVKETQKPLLSWTFGDCQGLRHSIWGIIETLHGMKKRGALEEDVGGSVLEGVGGGKRPFSPPPPPRLPTVQIPLEILAAEGSAQKMLLQ